MDELNEAMGLMGEKEKLALLKGLQKAGQEWLTDAHFKEQFDHGIKIANDKGDDDLILQFWLFGRPYKKEETEEAVVPALVAIDFDNDKDKIECMKGIGAKYAQQFPDHMLTTIVHISEAWQSQRAIDQPEEDAELMPSKSPNREEIVLVSALSMDMRQAWYSGDIIRSSDGGFLKIETVKYEMHDSNDPIDPKHMQNRLSQAILYGYHQAKGLEREKTDDTETK